MLTVLKECVGNRKLHKEGWPEVSSFLWSFTPIAGLNLVLLKEENSDK